MSEFGGDPTVSMTAGPVGPGVVGVTLHSHGHAVEATLSNGRYAAWWPGPLFGEFHGPSGEGGPEPEITYDLTYSDGTVARDVTPVLGPVLGD